MSSFLPVNNAPSSHDRIMHDSPAPRADLHNPSTAAADKDAAHPSHPSPTADDDSSRPTTAKGSGSEEPAPGTGPGGESDGDHGDREGSDNETGDTRSNAGPPSKKKKGQRFFCTDFPPCTLSFTRSEHLARHIRKHTGERPFQCHCSRRFSRLDNLRQHAQTVHVNEDIPGDSLAATGTRFQRQIRTDRVRPQGRARAGTAGSQGTHSRGHSRNLSGSSIASTASSFSQPEIRRRPPPLIMANDGSARTTRLAVDTMAEAPTTPPAQIHGISGPPPGGSPYATPGMFVANGSPHYASPMSAVSSHASGFWDGRTPTRRLSVPSGANPFVQHATTYPPPYVNSSPYPSLGVYASPTSTHHSENAGISAAEAERRRRTWHPSTYSTLPRPVSNGGVSGQQTPETLQPAFGANGSAEPPPRLPGIESFDKVLSQQPPLTPPTRKRTPMEIDSPSKPPPPPPSLPPSQSSNSLFGGGFSYSHPSVRPPPPIPGPGHRRGHVSWDVSLHRNLTGLDITDRASQKDASHWGQQTIAEIQNVASGSAPSHHQQPPAPSKPGYYPSSTPGTTFGPLATRTSPEDSSSSEGAPTPSTASLEYHPAIVHSSGYVEPHQHPIPSDVPQSVCYISLSLSVCLS